jgi:hypothetical protein
MRTNNCIAYRPLYEQDLHDDDIRSKYLADDELVNDARGYMVDIWIYDDHFKKVKNIKVTLAVYCILLANDF